MIFLFFWQAAKESFSGHRYIFCREKDYIRELNSAGERAEGSGGQIASASFIRHKTRRNEENDEYKSQFINYTEQAA